ncbi:MAG: rRNA maturation RNase YbeY [Candidatus Komeilibacteria bacterium]
MLKFVMSGGQASDWRWLLVWGKVVGQKYQPKQEVSLAVISPQRMRQLNRQWRHQDKATDVLSFRLAGSAEDTVLGEILICRSVAARQAKQQGHSLLRELQILTIHGTLHLLGYDHEQEREARVMMALEKKLLRQLLLVA